MSGEYYVLTQHKPSQSDVDFRFCSNMLTGRRPDRQRQFSLEPYEVAPLLLSFMVRPAANRSKNLRLLVSDPQAQQVVVS